MVAARRDRSITPREPGRPKVSREVRERQMLEVAERAFAERGFNGASVDAIAEGAGISKPMVYAYFESKDGLYRACMERARQRLYDAINEGADAAAAPDEQLWLGLLAFLTFVDEQRDSWVVLFGEVAVGAGPFAEEGARMRRGIARLVGQLLRDAAETEDARASRLDATEPLAHALIGAAESVAGWWSEHPEESKETVALWLMNFAWMGFRGLVRGETWLAPALGADVRRSAG